MIAVKLEGRLGNQLFQYAFAYATAKKLGTSFYLDKSIADFIPAKYFDLKQDFIKPLDVSLFDIKGYKNLFNVRLKQGFYKKLEQLIFGLKAITIDNDQPVTNALDKLRNNHMYVGYFQSEKYFREITTELKQLLCIKKNYVNQFAAVINQLPLYTKTIVIHLRRGDYVGLNWSLPLSYYKKALIAAGYEEALCIFISDDQELIEQEFSYIEHKYISNHSDIIDLQFLINADVCVLSASSFSWWGAWLNANEHKQLFAPKHWLGFTIGKEYPAGIADGLDFNWIDV
jgi:hypothetical protein